VVGRIISDKPGELTFSLEENWPGFSSEFSADKNGVIGVAHLASGGDVTWKLQTSPAPKSMDGKEVDEFIRLISETRAVPEESLEAYRKGMVGAVGSKSQQNELGNWASRQAYIALGFLLETAALKGIDSCPMEGFDSKKFDVILGLDKNNFESRVVCTLGYRSENDTYAKQKKVRFSSGKTFEEIN